MDNSRGDWDALVTGKLGGKLVVGNLELRGKLGGKLVVGDLELRGKSVVGELIGRLVTGDDLTWGSSVWAIANDNDTSGDAEVLNV